MNKHTTNEITNQEYQTAKSIVEEYEANQTIWICHENLFVQNDRCFTFAKEYKQVNVFSEDFQLIDDDGDCHDVDKWEEHFTRKPLPEPPNK